MEVTLDKVENAATMTDATKQALAKIGKQAERQEAPKAPRGKVKSGPETPDELEQTIVDAMQDANSTLEAFNRTQFVDGIKDLIKAEHFASVNQKVLGGFVTRYLAADEKTQASIRLTFAGDREYPKHYPAGATPQQALAEVLFMDYPEMFEKSTSGDTLAVKRITNWTQAFKGEVKKAALSTDAERRAELERMGFITLDKAVATAEENGLHAKPVEVPTTAATTDGRRKRLSEEKVIGALYREASAVASHEKQLEYRRWLLNAARNIGIDDDKITKAVGEILQGQKTEPMKKTTVPAEKTA